VQIKTVVDNTNSTIITNKKPNLIDVERGGW